MIHDAGAGGVRRIGQYVSTLHYIYVQVPSCVENGIRTVMGHLLPTSGCSSTLNR